MYAATGHEYSVGVLPLAQESLGCGRVELNEGRGYGLVNAKLAFTLKFEDGMATVYMGIDTE